MLKDEWIKAVLAAAFVVALLFTGLFAVRTVRRAIYWDRHRDEQIRPWMSIHYVARSYRVPPPVLYKAVGLTPGPPDRRPLRQIAAEQNRPVEELISALQAAISRERSGKPPDGPARSPSASSSGGLAP